MCVGSGIACRILDISCVLLVDSAGRVGYAGRKILLHNDVQCCNVQSGLLTSSSNSSSCGMGEGTLSTCRSMEINNGNWFRESASAALLWTPGM